MSQISQENLLWSIKEDLKQQFELLTQEQQAQLLGFLNQVEGIETLSKDNWIFQVQVRGLMTSQQKEQYMQIWRQRGVNYWQTRYIKEVLKII